MVYICVDAYMIQLTYLSLFSLIRMSNRLMLLEYSSFGTSSTKISRSLAILNPDLIAYLPFFARSELSAFKDSTIPEDRREYSAHPFAFTFSICSEEFHALPNISFLAVDPFDANSLLLPYCNVFVLDSLVKLY
jgi:hypothetical protein